LLGRHNVVNITGAIAVAHTLNVSWDVLKQLVSSLSYVEHRLQIIENEAYTIIDNAYNSNPEGAHYALEVMKQLDGKRVIITPGFLDLGKDSKQAHYEFGCYMAQCVDEVILVGKQQTKDIVVGLREKKFPLSKLHIVTTIQEAFSCLNSIATPDTTVLLENDLPDAFNH
ncbi:MAG: cyanophycin synthetase, partial [Longicatena sp.]